MKGKDVESRNNASSGAASATAAIPTIIAFVPPLALIVSVLGLFHLLLEGMADHTYRVSVSISVLFMLDVVVFRHTRARWFGLHAAVNAVIVILCLGDLYRVCVDPLNTLLINDMDQWPMDLVLTIHLYHVSFFPSVFNIFGGSRLYSIDWVHHGVMIALGWPACVLCKFGPLLNYTYFFVCGLPGGLDYAMLFAVKNGWMTPLQEKRINTVLNVWLRGPFLIGSVLGAYLQCHLELAEGREIPPVRLAARIFVMAIQGWNAQYFMERVAGNYHVAMWRVKQAKREEEEEKGSVTAAEERPLSSSVVTRAAAEAARNAKGARRRTTSDRSDFGSEDHLLPSGPEAFGLSRRVKLKIRSLKEGGS